MRFEPSYEVQLLRPDGGAAFVEVSHSGKHYVIGEPGQPFDTRVTANPSLFVSSDIAVRIKVDGRSLGQNRHITPTDRATVFQGFVSTVGNRHIVNQLVFSDTNTGREPGASQNGLGTVKIRLVAVEATAEQKELRTLSTKPAGAAVPGVIEGTDC